VRSFHDAVRARGALPLDILEAQLDAWIARTRAAPPPPQNAAPRSPPDTADDPTSRDLVTSP
jgi:hypothetical protein